MVTKMSNLAIPNFHLIERIGEGGFGEVWRAKTITGKRRAVKIVHRSRFEGPEIDPTELETFFQLEFSGVRRFEDLAATDPALITIHHVGRAESGDFYYYIMPLADDATPPPDYQALTLERKIARDGPMDWTEATAMIHSLASGLDTLHRNGLCHGDVSSANILYLDGQPVLADPGLTGLDGKARIAASPGFDDPSAGLVAKRDGDIFALGRVFYHALTGMHPAESFPLVPPVRMMAVPAAKMADFLDRCCDPDPANRFPNVAALIAYLDAESQAVPGENPPPTQGPRRDAAVIPRIATIAFLVSLGLAAWAILGGRTPPPPGHAEIADGWLMVYDTKGGKLLWSRNMGMSLIQAEVRDINGNGTPEILCAVQDIGRQAGGRMLVFDHGGDLLWQFDTTPEFQNFPGFEGAKMTLLGFVAARLDDASPRKSLVLATFEAHGWFPTALHFLDVDGTLTATYWHPGHIHPQDLVFVRETPDSPPMLAFKAVNNHIGKRYQDLDPGRQKFHCTFALLDPRATGHNEAPPGNGRLNGHDEMTVFYRVLDPQWAAISRIRTQDTTRDGRNELIIWSQFGSRAEFTTERINCGHVLDFQGNQLAIQPGNGHIAESILVDPETIDAR